METALKFAAGGQVRIFPDTVSLSRSAAEFFVSLARRKSPGERFAIALSGGSTPKLLYTFLASSPCREAVAWRHLHVFWADERCVPPNHPQSNYKLAFDTLLSHVPLPAANIHRISGEDGPGRAAEAYELELRAFFGESRLPVFDLIILGAGEDGHTASLFPGSSAVMEKKRMATPVLLDPPDISRVTLTLPVLSNASQVVFLLAGRSKAGVAHEVLEDGNPRQYPAGMVHPVQGNLLWMLDRDAAGALRPSLAGALIDE